MRPPGERITCGQFSHHQGSPSMSDSKPTKGLRFAALVRVSTEKQEEQGESLKTQRTYNARDVERLEASIVDWYGGQEHATEGWEKAEVDRLVSDSGKGKFDAVIVTNADRWSRDNVKSHQGLEAFRENDIRFFVGGTEYDLFNPEHVLFLDMSAVFGKFQALHQARKSLLNRIERARKGQNTAGRPPFGRRWDGTKWVIEPHKQQLVEECARRYLEGEFLPTLAQEFGIGATTLHTILMSRCGPTWKQTFKSKRLNICEEVEITIPELLPPETITAIRERARGNTHYSHGQLKHDYLLSRMVFCSSCGQALSGSCTGPHRYYRHFASKRQGVACPH